MADPVQTRRVDSTATSGAAGWGFPAGLVLFALLLLLAVSRVQPLDPKPQDAPADEFSAGRARQILETLIGDGRPHPTGSPANAAVRDRVLAELRRLGYAPEVQPDVVCVDFGCARIENIVARLEGREPGKTVLFMAHYDSVAAGPGVSDDVTGVATVLEVARILKAGPQPRNTVVFLIDDGEEPGLLGARAFIRRPEARNVGVVVNVEARGSSGPSLMFETSGHNGWMVPLYAGNATRPITSSVFATIYDYLPNDTDLSIFKEQGYNGLNFAYIGNPTHYHTSEDNLENASTASLQHHGDNALAAVRAFAEADLTNPPPGNAVFFDILGWTVVRWPMGWSIVLAILTLVLVIAATVLAVRGRVITGGAAAVGFLGFLGMVVAAGVLAFALVQGVFAGRLAANWVANSFPLEAAFWLLSFAVVLAVASLLARRSGLIGTWAGVWIAWAVVALVLAVLAPGLSYLFLVPALVAGVAGLVSFARRGAGRNGANGVVAALLPALVMALLWFPLISFLYKGLGGGGLLPIGVLAALAATTLAPLAAGSGPGLRRWVPIAALLVAVVCVFLALSSPAVTAASPQPVSIHYHQDADSGQARWLLRGFPPIPRQLLEAAEFDRQPVKAYTWSPDFSRALAAPAPPLGAPAPELTVVEDTTAGGKRRVRLRVTSPRQAASATLMIPKVAGLESLKANGVEVPLTPQNNPAFNWSNFTYMTLPPEGVELEAVLSSTSRHEWHVLDQTYGLPPGGEKLLKARPETAVPFQDGEITVMSRRVQV